MSEWMRRLWCRIAGHRWVPDGWEIGANLYRCPRCGARGSRLSFGLPDDFFEPDYEPGHYHGNHPESHNE